MKRVNLLLVLFLFSSCAGQRKLGPAANYTQLKNQDCKTLFQKQRLQYKIAIREGKANDRRRNAISSKNKRSQGNKTAIATASSAGVYHKQISYAHSAIPDGALTPFQKGYMRSLGSATHLFISLTEPAKDIHQKDQNLKKDPRQTKTRSAVLTSFNSSSLSLFCIGIAGLTGMALLKLFQRNAQRISHWAKKNPWKTRGSIMVAQIGMGVTGLWLGNYLYETGIMIPEYDRLAAAGLFTVAAIFYPSTYHANGSPAFSYLQRKIHDAALFTTGAMLTVYAGNHYNITLRQADSMELAAPISVREEKIFSAKFTNRQISVVKKEFNSRLEKYFEGPRKGKTKGEKVALTILVSIGFAFLTAGVAAASCNLSCSGNEVAAIAVLVAGGALIAWGLSTALKSIHRSPTIEKKPKVQPSV